MADFPAITIMTGGDVSHPPMPKSVVDEHRFANFCPAAD